MTGAAEPNLPSDRSASADDGKNITVDLSGNSGYNIKISLWVKPNNNLDSATYVSISITYAGCLLTKYQENSDSDSVQHFDL